MRPVNIQLIFTIVIISISFIQYGCNNSITNNCTLVKPAEEKLIADYFNNSDSLSLYDVTNICVIDIPFLENYPDLKSKIDSMNMIVDEAYLLLDNYIKNHNTEEILKLNYNYKTVLSYRDGLQKVRHRNMDDISSYVGRPLFYLNISTVFNYPDFPDYKNMQEKGEYMHEVYVNIYSRFYIMVTNKFNVPRARFDNGLAEGHQLFYVTALPKGSVENDNAKHFVFTDGEYPEGSMTLISQ